MAGDRLSIAPDHSTGNADWIKDGEHGWDLPTDAQGFLDQLGVGDKTRLAKYMEVKRFINTKPVAKRMPQELREELDDQGVLPHEEKRKPRAGDIVRAKTMGEYEGVDEEVHGRIEIRYDKESGEPRYFVPVQKDGRNINVSVWPESVEVVE